MAQNEEKAAETFEVQLNADTGLNGYGFSEPVLKEDKEADGGPVITEFRLGVPRRATKAEYDRLAQDKRDGKQIVKKV